MKNIGFMLIAFVLLLVTSCNNKSATTELAAFKSVEKLEEQNKQIVQRYWEGKWNERRPDILDELQTPDVVYHGVSITMNGIAEYKQIFEKYLSAMHDSQVVINKLMAEGDLVMTSVVLNATHKEELNGLPPTGNKVSVSMFTIFRLVDGKIAEEWEILDELGMMTQLGFELQMKE